MHEFRLINMGNGVGLVRDDIAGRALPSTTGVNGAPSTTGVNGAGIVAHQKE